MTVFALVHGAWGVPQEWDGVAGALRGMGHDAIALDLPITDPRAGLRQYADAMVRGLEHVQEPVVIVAQSAGGHTAALIPALRPVLRVVYLTAFVPIPGQPFWVRHPGQPLSSCTGDDVELVSPAFRALIQDRGDGTSELDVRGLAAFLAGEGMAEYVIPLLTPMLRPNGVRAFEEPWPLQALPQVPSSYLLGSADPVLPPDTQRKFAARLGVEPIVIQGGDHGTHMKRPRQVARILHELTKTDSGEARVSSTS